MAVYILGAVIAYLVGSINTAFIVATLKKKNLRSGGSGNLGASNTAILLGFKWGLFVGIVDILKGFVLVIISKYVLSDYSYLPYIVTSAVIIGHIFPFYLKFKGGKGFASLVGCIFGFDWRVGLVAAVLIIAITVISDYIVLATLTTIILYPITVGIMTHSIINPLILSVSLICIFIKHLPNFKRIIKKEEIGFRSSFDKKHKI